MFALSLSRKIQLFPKTVLGRIQRWWHKSNEVINSKWSHSNVEGILFTGMLLYHCTEYKQRHVFNVSLLSTRTISVLSYTIFRLFNYSLLQVFIFKRTVSIYEYLYWNLIGLTGVRTCSRFVSKVHTQFEHSPIITEL